tara:strand:+ start:1512 stop:2228 length:717 start_codon:yes stop_codon:yes gene_type:complete
MMTVIILLLLAALCLLFLFIPWFKKKQQLIKWYKHHRILEHEACFNRLYHNVNGFLLSKHARAEYDSPDLTYGEIDFKSFIALIDACNPNQDTIFYDLGCGTGKAVMAISLVFNIQKACGIECLQPLYDAAVRVEEKWRASVNQHLSDQQIIFHHQNFLDTDFSDATLIFVNATAFFGPVWFHLCEKLLETKVNTIIITTSKPIESNSFQIIKEQEVLMSWGVVRSFIQKKIPPISHH